jgi:hypothetical protein
MLEGKGTESSYRRGIKEYEEWWPQYQEEKRRENPQWIIEGCHPITARKVAVFLEYYTTRARVRQSLVLSMAFGLQFEQRDSSGREIPGTTLGPSAVSVLINALESYRRNHMHLNIYEQCPEAHISLRTDIRIRTFEKAAKSNEPKRRREANTLKTLGASSGKYSVKNLVVLCADTLLCRHLHGS